MLETLTIRFDRKSPRGRAKAHSLGDLYFVYEGGGSLDFAAFEIQ